MTGRRAPLANVPNAVNSPFRNVTSIAGKRTRAQAGEKDLAYGQPAAKRQVIEIPDDGDENIAPPRTRLIQSQDPEEKVFMKKTTSTQPTAFERKLASVREKRQDTQRQAEKPQKAGDEHNLETIRQWQKHYRRQFPHFVFYFESVPDDVRNKALRQIHQLGAKDEKFFSKAVTHVITTRPIPPEHHNTSPEDEQPALSKPESSRPPAGSRTINPLVLGHEQRRPVSNALDANLQRRAQSQASQLQHEVDPRKQQAPGTDVLSKARELGIKIWALEKIQRILHAIYDADTGEQSSTITTKCSVTVAQPAKPSKQADLEQLLRNEKVNGPADRDMTVAGQDMLSFRGCYLYLHDMDEKTRPVMVRDYPKPTTKEQGKWPQFRLTPAGRCPFIEDPAHAKKLKQEEQRLHLEQGAAQRKTRATSALDAARRQPGVLAERQANLRRSPRKLAQDSKPELSKPLDPPRMLPTKRQPSTDGMPPLFGSAQQSLRGLPRLVGGEPIASGVQPSNVTSAIRSQVISSAAMSSTAPAMNSRVGTSKDLATLKKKVLERGVSINSNQSVPSSYLNEMRAAINDDCGPPPRAAKTKAQQTLGRIYEDREPHQREDTSKPARQLPKKKKTVEKELKPGYCENCRDKFDDFDSHIQSRKHRKFAVTADNWKELDALLGQLKRPHKDH